MPRGIAQYYIPNTKTNIDFNSIRMRSIESITKRKMKYPKCSSSCNRTISQQTKP